MRAVIVTEYGGTPVVAEVATPEPGTGEVLLRVEAAGMNPMDRRLASGDWQPAPATFPMVLGADGAGIVEKVGDGTTRFSPGDALFGQLLIAPIGSAGTYAEYVAVTEEAPLARVPNGLDPVLAAAVPTSGGAALAMLDLLEPLSGKTVLIVGAGGGIGSFATQLAANAGAHVIANVRADAAERIRGYGAGEIVDHTTVSLVDAVRQAHPDGIDALMDLVSDADAFVALASLVRPRGTAITTQYVADVDTLAAAGVTGINFALQETPGLLERVADALVSGRIVAPPITRIALEDAPAQAFAEEVEADVPEVVSAMHVARICPGEHLSARAECDLLGHDLGLISPPPPGSDCGTRASVSRARASAVRPSARSSPTSVSRMSRPPLTHTNPRATSKRSLWGSP
jgi:NADPH:quinone reductase